MSSNESSEFLDLETDLPTTEADVAALRRLRHTVELTLAEALDLLSDSDLFALERADRIASGDWEPFQL